MIHWTRFLKKNHRKILEKPEAIFFEPKKNQSPKPNIGCIEDDDIPKKEIAFKFIKATELSELMKKTGSENEKLLIVDNRAPFEYHGGHIISAINIFLYDSLVKFYHSHIGENVTIVFHCEFSRKRGPAFIGMFRTYDRCLNEYTNISFPNIFLLEGGYSEFYRKHKELTIGGYIPNEHSEYYEQSKRSLKIFKEQIKIYRQKIRPKTRSHSQNRITSPIIHKPISFSQVVISDFIEN